MNNNIFTPANATFPVQDNFGQVIVAHGLNKLEIATILIASSMAGATLGNIEPETIATEAAKIAISCFEETDKIFQEHTKPNIIK